MKYIELIEEIREELLQIVNQRCDALLWMYQNGEQNNYSWVETRECRLAWISPATLKGKRPLSLTFPSGETVATPTWKKLAQTILKHCNEQPDMHERLMQLRGKVFGRQRIILGEFPERMDVPIRIDQDLYFEAKFDTEALITMMERKILEPVGYDFSEIVIQYAEKKQVISEEPKITQDVNKEELQSGGMKFS